MEEIWHHYAELITDPAHTMVETTFILAEFIIFTWGWNRHKKLIKREHRVIDAEHGHKHDPELSEVSDRVSDKQIVQSLLARRNDPEVDALVEALLRNRQKD